MSDGASQPASARRLTLAHALRERHAPATLRGPALAIARASWLAVAALVLAAFGAGVPRRLAGL